MQAGSTVGAATGVCGCRCSSQHGSVRMPAEAAAPGRGVDHTVRAERQAIRASRYDRYPLLVHLMTGARLTRSKHDAWFGNPTVPFRPVRGGSGAGSTLGDVVAPDESDDPADILRQAAFGEWIGDALPAAVTALDAWHRAVALGGRGYYSGARAELRRARVSGASKTLLSLVASTEASFLRQLGDHRSAARLDGAAWASATDRAGAADAATGLAADALGMGRRALSRRLLERAAVEVHGRDALRGSSHFGSCSTGESGLWRQRIRLDWVTAELAMAGREPARAMEFARSASVQAETSGSVRHIVKSRVILAAAHCVSGELDTGVKMADDVQKLCERHGLLPLCWAAAMLSNGVRPSPGGAATVSACENEIERRGGVFRKPPLLPGGVGTGS